MSSSEMGEGCPLFDVVHPAFPLPITATPTLQGARKNGFGGAIMAYTLRVFSFRPNCGHKGSTVEY